MDYQKRFLQTMYLYSPVQKFTEFIEKNGMRHICTSPYHSASNRLAERAIQIFKHGVSQLEEKVHGKFGYPDSYSSIASHRTLQLEGPQQNYCWANSQDQDWICCTLTLTPKCWTTKQGTTSNRELEGSRWETESTSGTSLKHNLA